jgi:hypothetical protein
MRTWYPCVAGLALALHGSPLAAEVACRPVERATLAESVRSEGLQALAEANTQGLGQEAGGISDWIAARPQARLTLAERSLLDETGRRLPLSPGMVLALRRLDQWYSLASATAARPITHQELRAAALAPASVERIAALFEASTRQGFRLDGAWQVRETGGEASLDDELRLREQPDPGGPLLQELARAIDDPQKLAALRDQHGLELALLDEHGILRAALRRIELGVAPAASGLHSAVATVVQNAARAYSLDPPGQLALIVGSDWCGRYVGRWHTHPPHDTGTGWAGGDVPSFEDMRNAVQDGQFLTLSFQPDGFDLYDATRLGEQARVDLSLLDVIRHRSTAWQERFARLHEALAARPRTSD